MKIEKSCGAVVFTKENGILQYVIIQAKNGTYGFPKGHMESNETEKETALREIQEETGLRVEFIDGFRKETSYTFSWNREKIFKQVIFFLATYQNQTPIPQESELCAVHLMDFSTAIHKLPFDNLKNVLLDAHRLLTE